MSDRPLPFIPLLKAPPKAAPPKHFAPNLPPYTANNNNNTIDINPYSSQVDRRPPTPPPKPQYMIPQEEKEYAVGDLETTDSVSQDNSNGSSPEKAADKLSSDSDDDKTQTTSGAAALLARNEELRASITRHNNALASLQKELDSLLPYAP